MGEGTNLITSRCENAPTYWADEGKGPYYKSGLTGSGANSAYPTRMSIALVIKAPALLKLHPKPGEMVIIPQGVAAAIKHLLLVRLSVCQENHDLK